jgi:HEAT repeat protein
MPKQEKIDVAASLAALFKAERDARKISDRLLHAPHAEVLDQITQAIAEARKQTSDQERGLRLVCLTRVLRNVPGPKAVDLLVDILNDDVEEARVAAGMVLEDMASERLGDVQRGIQRAIEHLPVGSIALCEIPFVVLGLEDVDVLKMLQPLLAHADPEAVGAAIEALVELADPAAIALIEPLCNDTRTIRMDDESTGDSEQISVGDLATDAVEALREVDTIVRPASG